MRTVLFTGLLQLATVLQLAAQHPAVRAIAIDERLAADAGLRVGDLVIVSAEPGTGGDTVRIGAIVQRNADPSEIARSEYRVRLHLDQLQSLSGIGDRVDRFAVAVRDSVSEQRALSAINAAAFGFRAHRSRDIAVESSATFKVVSRFHRAIGIITVVASAIFLLCILLLKVDERRRDVAALRLLGVSRRSVMQSVVLEATLIAALGTALGAALGWITSWLVNVHYQGVYRTPLRFAIVTPGVLEFALGLSLALGFAAGVLAARRLVRTPPLALLGR
jgi:putative ABC transport system permease protein